jgi:hypothetical protein
MAHRTQLHICHELLGTPGSGDRTVPAAVARYCNNAAGRWCYTCGYYVCVQHAHARHAGHRLGRQ